VGRDDTRSPHFFKLCKNQYPRFNEYAGKLDPNAEVNAPQHFDRMLAARPIQALNPLMNGCATTVQRYAKETIAEWFYHGNGGSGGDQSRVAGPHAIGGAPNGPDRFPE